MPAGPNRLSPLRFVLIFGVVSAFAHLTGQSIPTAIGTGFTVIDKSNVADPNVAKYIYSD